jgi:hypothetical protein
MAFSQRLEIPHKGEEIEFFRNIVAESSIFLVNEVLERRPSERNDVLLAEKSGKNRDFGKVLSFSDFCK